VSLNGNMVPAAAAPWREKLKSMDVRRVAEARAPEKAKGTVTDLETEGHLSPLGGTRYRLVMGIETSCDETAVALVEGSKVLASVVSSQAKLHERFGGVVPEVASRAHLDLILPAIRAACEDAGRGMESVEAVAATVGPGLVGSLLVGVAAGKALSLALDVPFIGVNHHEAHLFAAWLDEAPPPVLPAVVLLVAGGHTMLVYMKRPGSYRLLGQTIDDAAGEAFDKVARFLGLGYPGGPAIEQAARQGDPTALDLPRPLLRRGLDFSFSGLKTAVIRQVKALQAQGDLGTKVTVADVAASFQAAVVDVLVAKTMSALEEVRARSVVLAGGVAANEALRISISEACKARGVAAFLPSKRACTDNGAMVAACGMWHLNYGTPADLEVGVDPSATLNFGDAA
jgi:N6-L-threonylcarbamoyladenine synthase